MTDAPLDEPPKEGDQLPEEAPPGQGGESHPDERAREVGLDPNPDDEAPPRPPATGNPHDEEAGAG